MASLRTRISELLAKRTDHRPRKGGTNKGRKLLPEEDRLSETFFVTMTPKMSRRMTALASAQERPITTLIREAVAEYLKTNYPER